MLTAKLSVRYEQDWTAELKRKGVTGQFLASMFRDRQYLGLFALETPEQAYTDVVDTIHKHEKIDSLDIIECYDVEGSDHVSATTIIEAQYFEFTPLQVLLHEGFIPLANYGEVRDGRISFDLLLSSRENLAESVSLIERFGPVRIEHVSQDFERRITPSVTEWANLFEAITPRRRRVLNTALEAGYFDLPRGCTLEDIADEVGIAKTTASQHLRKAEKDLMEFFIKYLNISG